MLGEEQYKHYHQVGNFLRVRHSKNLPVGAQMCSNLQYAWLRSLPQVAQLQAEAEGKASKCGDLVRKKMFSSTAT